MKRILALVVGTLAATGCAGSQQDAARAEIERCFRATPSENGDTLQISSEAVIFNVPGEGGIFARSDACPEVRLQLVRSPADVTRRIDEISRDPNAVRSGTIVNLVGSVHPEAYRDDGLISIRIVRLDSLTKVSDERDAAFRTRFNMR